VCQTPARDAPDSELPARPDLLFRNIKSGLEGRGSNFLAVPDLNARFQIRRRSDGAEGLSASAAASAGSEHGMGASSSPRGRRNQELLPGKLPEISAVRGTRRENPGGGAREMSERMGPMSEFDRRLASNELGMGAPAWSESAAPVPSARSWNRGGAMTEGRKNLGLSQSLGAMGSKPNWLGRRLLEGSQSWRACGRAPAAASGKALGFKPACTAE
jgi:hypothetical protein